MTVQQALGLSPDAVIVPPDPVLYRNVWDTVLSALDDISPEVEDEEVGRAYLNASGLQSLYRDEQALGRCTLNAVKAASGLDAATGIAAGKFTAFAAAFAGCSGEPCVVPPGEEGAFLAPFDVGLLPVSAETNRRLRLLGIESIGEVAGFSLPELQSQFGFEGKRLWQLANGVDDAPLRPRRRQELLEASLSFEAPVAGIDVMIAASKQLFSRLRLPLRGRATRELWLQAELVSGRAWAKQVVLREAVSEEARLSFILRSTLSNFPPPSAITSLSLRLGGLSGESGKQLALGERGRLQRQLEEAIRQLKARYGHSPIYRCVDVEPWSAIPEERQILVESDA